MHYQRDELKLNGLRRTVLRRAGDIAREASTVAAPERDLRPRRGRRVGGISLDGARTGRTAERPATSITRNQMKRLRWVVRVRTWLSHAPSPMVNRELSDESSSPLKKVTI